MFVLKFSGKQIILWDQKCYLLKSALSTGQPSNNNLIIVTSYLPTISDKCWDKRNSRIELE